MYRYYQERLYITHRNMSRSMSGSSSSRFTSSLAYVSPDSSNSSSSSDRSESTTYLMAHALADTGPSIQVIAHQPHDTRRARMAWDCISATGAQEYTAGGLGSANTISGNTAPHPAWRQSRSTASYFAKTPIGTVLFVSLWALSMHRLKKPDVAAGLFFRSVFIIARKEINESPSI